MEKELALTAGKTMTSVIVSSVGVVSSSGGIILGIENFNEFTIGSIYCSISNIDNFIFVRLLPQRNSKKLQKNKGDKMDYGINSSTIWIGRVV